MYTLSPSEVLEMCFACTILGFLVGAFCGWRVAVNNITNAAWQYAVDAIADFRQKTIAEIDAVGRSIAIMVQEKESILDAFRRTVRARISRLSHFPTWYERAVKACDEINKQAPEFGRKFHDMELPKMSQPFSPDPSRDGQPSPYSTPNPEQNATPFDAVKADVEASCLAGFIKLLDAFIAKNRLVPDAARVLQEMKAKLTSAAMPQKGDGE